jgi:hypothetical protein
MKKAKGFAPQNSGAHVDMATKLFLPRQGGPAVHLCTYTLPADADERAVRTDAQDPILITAYPHPGAAGDAFEGILRLIRQEGWEHIDTGNWTTATVYPGVSAQSIRRAQPSMAIRIRKLSPAQRARAVEEFDFQLPENLPILQVRLADKSGSWPGDSDYEKYALLADSYMDSILGDLA